VPVAFVIIFMEMKVIAFLASRVGPNRTGPWGHAVRPSFHGFKVLAKEDFTPTGADAPVFTFAPVVVYLAAVLTLLGDPICARPGSAWT
jgi:NADH-quinone oxidoreductase subunit H